MKNSVKIISILLVFQLSVLSACGKTEEIKVQEAEERTDISVTMAGETEAKAASVQKEEEYLFENCYYYEQLSEAQQEIYKQVYRALTKRTEVAVSTLLPQELDKVYTCVLNDHPEIFYTESYICTTHSRNNETVKLSFRGQYTYDESESADRIALMEKEKERILSGIPQGATDFEKIKYVFDTLVNETEYVTDAKDNQNICSVLIGQESTCQGYAKATQYLLNGAGIDTTLVTGNVAGESHAWNLVMSDGEWYYLDTTWGDVDYQSLQENSVDKEVMPVNYDYFLIASDRLYETHTPSRIVPLPDCAATADNYYVHEGLYVTGLDARLLHEIFAKAYEKGEGIVRFQCANDAVFEQVSAYLLEEQHIFDFVDTLNSVPYFDNPETDTFCFWL